jgi:chromosome segregation ATPase
MTARGDNIVARGSEWNDGQKDMLKGQKLIQQSADRITDAEKRIQRAQNDIAKAEARIRTAQADRVTGEQLIASGTSRMQQAEASYNQIRREPSALTP